MPILNSHVSSLLVAPVIALTVLGAGCGSSSRLIDIDTNTLTIPGDNGGSFSLGEGAKIPENFPSHFPKYPNGKTTLAFSENDGKSGSLVQQTNDSYTEAQTQIENAMQSQGFTKENVLSSPNLVILSFTKGTTRCQVNIVQQDTLTQIQTTCVEQ
jgi:hypothetical protein